MIRRAFVIVLLWSWGVSFATVLRVPQDYPTIQAALDALSDGDTVMVSPAVYGEALQAPGSLSFTLAGERNVGGEPEIPIIDPSHLEGSTELACLVLPAESRAVIADMVFRNGPEMYPRRHGNDVGGIVHNGLEMTVRSCTFDSVSRGISLADGTPGTFEADNCDFLESFGGGIRDWNPSPALIRNCRFWGTHDGALAYCFDNTTIDSCDFLWWPQPGGSFIWLMGERNALRNCTFGQVATWSWNVIFTSEGSAPLRGCVFENNLFRDLQVSGQVIVFYGAEGDTSYFRNNIFRNCHGTISLGAGGGIYIASTAGTAPVAVSDCSFDSCTANSSTGYGSLAVSMSDVSIARSRFVGHEAFAPNIRFFDAGQNGIHDCRFENTGMALWVYDYPPDTATDAQHNWWGDPTGPYHAQLNPDGLGDEVAGPVDFDPWLTDTILIVPDAPAPLPSSCRLAVYPNPFNSTAELRLRVDQPGRHTLALYNALGQYVKELWAGEIVGEKQIVVNGESLPSGLYFVRVRQVNTGQTTATAKVLLLK